MTMRTVRRSVFATALTVVAALLSQAWPAHAADTELPQIQPGAIELGISGAFTSVESTSRADVGLSAARFIAFGPGLAAAELRVGYEHISSLDRFDIEAGVSWQRALSGTSIYPYVAIGGGVRQEKIGSFNETRYPIGAALGLRTLAGTMVGARIEYRYRRLMNDPIADFNENEVRFGLSLYLMNAARE